MPPAYRHIEPATRQRKRSNQALPNRQPRRPEVLPVTQEGQTTASDENTPWRGRRSRPQSNGRFPRQAHAEESCVFGQNQRVRIALHSQSRCRKSSFSAEIG